MNNHSGDLSHAIVSFLGYGSAFSPQKNRGHLIDLSIEQDIDAILSKLNTVNVDWTQHSLATAGKLARSQMAVEFPALSEAALDALEWKFTFDWR